MGHFRDRPIVTGAILALAGKGIPGGMSGGIVTPAPLEWTDIYGAIIASTNVQTLATITVPISITASGVSGGATLHYALNGTGMLYTGAFNVSAGDTLVWSVQNIGGGVLSGTITVVNASDSGAVLDAFAWTVEGTGGRM